MLKAYKFLSGDMTDPQMRYAFDYTWNMTLSDYEESHDFIQWMFPSPIPSAYNPDAPILTKEDVVAILADEEAKKCLLQFSKDYYRFLEMSDHWRVPGNHNLLRITRMFTCLRHVFGSTDRVVDLFTDVMRLYVPDDKTMAYWEEAIEGPLKW